MMIGPAPMIMMDLMSVRLGMVVFFRQATTFKVFVIASGAKQTRGREAGVLGCFGAHAPRNDDKSEKLQAAIIAVKRSNR